MSFRDDLDYLKDNYPVFGLVRELQLDRGYTLGVVPEQSDRDRKTRCPIHDDSEPSSKVYLATNSVYCWVCHKAWDPPGLFNAYYGCGLREAVRVLLRRLGRTPTADPTDPDGKVALRQMIADLEAAQNAPPKPDSTRAWLAEIRLWAGDLVDAYPALEEVEDATRWAAALAPVDCARVVRQTLAWAICVHPGLEREMGPIVEDPTAAYIAGVPSPTTGKD